MARSALQAMGEQDLDLPRLEPFRFRILAGGKPLASTQVLFQAVEASGQVGTDAEGVLSLDYDKVYPSQEVLLRSNPITTPGNLWFSVSSAVPRPSEVQDVQIADVTLRIRAAESAAAVGLLGQKVQISLSTEEGSYRRPVLQWESALQGDLQFRISPGVYSRLQVHVPGATLWEMDRVEVPPQGRDINVLLSPGADLKFRLRASGRPKGYTRGFNYDLLRGRTSLGRFWVAHDQSRSHEGLPVGAYRLKVLSSREEGEWLARGAVSELPDPGFTHSGQEIHFEVRPGGPAEIDLGIIELARQPAAPKR